MVDATVAERRKSLKDVGLRVTPTRLAALKALSERPHSDTETLASMIGDEVGSVSMQSVYNVLGALVDNGLARRIEPAGSPALFEIRVGDNHHHVVCRDCGMTSDIDCAVGARPCLTPSETHGFILDEAEVTFWGLCPQCQGALGQLDLAASSQ